MNAIVLALLVVAQASDDPPPVEVAPELAPEEVGTEAPAKSAATQSAATQSAATQSAATQSAATAPADECLALLHAGEKHKAQECYAKRADGDDENARLAKELADVVSTLKLTEPALGGSPGGGPARPMATLDFATLLQTGKAELAATATLAGGYGAFLGTVSLFSATNGSIGGSGFAGLMLLAPVVGGGAALAGSVAAIMLWPGMTAGDANAMRAFLVLGFADSLLLAATMSSFNVDGRVAPYGMFAMQAAGAAAGIIVAVATDLPEHAGSFALSTGLWTPVLTTFVALMFKSFDGRAQIVSPFLIAGANAGFIAGLATAQLVPLTRADTWALDVGGGVGLLAGIATANAFRAPNPFVGWGTILAGTTLGMAGGVAAAKLVPGWIDGLPELFAVTPMTIPSIDGRSVALGAGLVGRID